MRPIRLFINLVVDEATFFGSPELIIYPHPAITRLAKKRSPTRTKTRLRRSCDNKLDKLVKDFMLSAVTVSLSRPEMSTSSTARTRFISDIVYFNPGRLRMLTPISLNKKTERMIKIRPEIAEVMIS